MGESRQGTEFGVYLGPLTTGKHPDKMASNIFKLFRSVGVHGCDISKVSVNPQVGFAKVELSSKECEDYTFTVLHEIRCVMNLFDLRKLTDKPQHLKVERIGGRTSKDYSDALNSPQPSDNRPVQGPLICSFSYNPVAAGSEDFTAALKQKQAEKKKSLSQENNPQVQSEEANPESAYTVSGTSTSFRFPTPPPSLTPSEVRAKAPSLPLAPASPSFSSTQTKGKEIQRPSGAGQASCTTAGGKVVALKESLRQKPEEYSYDVVTLSQTSSSDSQAEFEKLEEEETDTPTPQELLKVRSAYANFCDQREIHSRGPEKSPSCKMAGTGQKVRAESTSYQPDNSERKDRNTKLSTVISSKENLRQAADTIAGKAHAETCTSPIAPSFCEGPHFYHINQRVEITTENIFFGDKHLVVEDLREFRTLIGKYICAYLNTNGGVMFFGTDMHGLVVGIPMSHRYEDAVRLDIDSVIRFIEPIVPPSAYRVNFPRVMGSTGYLLPDMRILEINVFNPLQEEAGQLKEKRREKQPKYSYRERKYTFCKDELVSL